MFCDVPVISPCFSVRLFPTVAPQQASEAEGRSSHSAHRSAGPAAVTRLGRLVALVAQSAEGRSAELNYLQDIYTLKAQPASTARVVSGFINSHFVSLSKGTLATLQAGLFVGVEGFPSSLQCQTGCALSWLLSCALFSPPHGKHRQKAPWTQRGPPRCVALRHTGEGGSFCRRPRSLPLRNQSVSKSPFHLDKWLQVKSVKSAGCDAAFCFGCRN